MAAPDTKKDLTQVLRCYKNSSINSLQGPSLIECNKKVNDDSFHIVPNYSFKKALIYYESQVKRPPDENIDSKNWNTNDKAALSSPTPSVTSIEPICDDQHVTETITPIDNSNNNEENKIKIELDLKSVKNSNLESPSDITIKCSDEPGVFLAPAPFPPQPWPVLSVPDQGSPCPEAGRGETLLDTELIACFSIGGEKRLCLPQILNTVLCDFELTQINPVCEELQIHCRKCTPKQLEILKKTGVLPSIATSSGLITKTDAQRLTHNLIHILRAPRVANTSRYEKLQASLLRVSHNCFGKCKGAVWPDLYNSASDPCIECLECHLLFPPDRFVCHAHRNLENHVCHWGFDAENWRIFLRLSKDQPMNIQKAEEELTLFKNKFDPNASGNYKRKQVSLYSTNA